MAHGFKSGGRKAGVPNRRKGEVRAAIKAVVKKAVTKVEAATPGLFDGDSVDFLRMLYQDPNQSMSLRLSAAVAASKFERPQLAAIATATVTPVPTNRVETEARIRELLEGRGLVAIDSSGTDIGFVTLDDGGAAGAVAASGDPGT
jgi:hypothetical protein